MLLDTCAVLWLSFDEKKLSPQVLDRIDVGETALISSLSFWEIGIKIKQKKLEIPLSVSELVSRFSNIEQTEIVAPDAVIIVHALDLEWDHRDPVDRIIVATALKYNQQIITADAAIRRFYRDTAV